MLFSLSGCSVVRRIVEKIDSLSSTDEELPASAPISSNVVFEIIDDNGKVWLTNDDIAEVSYGFDPILSCFISFTSTEDGKQKFADATSENINKPLHILLDGVKISSPTVVEQITDGRFIISGITDEEEMLSLYKSFIR